MPKANEHLMSSINTLVWAYTKHGIKNINKADAIEIFSKILDEYEDRLVMDKLEGEDDSFILAGLGYNKVNPRGEVKYTRFKTDTNI